MPQVEHMEVAPRLWDKNIAATYTPKSKNSSDLEEKSDDDEPQTTDATPVVVASTGALSFITRLKTIALPAIFVICFLIVAYILWKYFTKYRNEKKAKHNEDTCLTLTESEIELNKNRPPNPSVIVATEDTSKYEYDSDSESETETKPACGLHTIKEEDAIDILKFNESEEEKEDESDSESDSSGSDADVSEEDSDDESKSEEPDMVVIKKLIEDTQYLDNDTMPSLEDDDEFSFQVPSYVEEIIPEVPKRQNSRKSKRITL